MREANDRFRAYEDLYQRCLNEMAGLPEDVKGAIAKAKLLGVATSIVKEMGVLKKRELKDDKDAAKTAAKAFTTLETLEAAMIEAKKNAGDN